MSWSVYLPYVAVMAIVTYLIRMLPLTLFRKPIKNRFVRSFLHYVPYAVLSAMTFPAIFYSTGFSSSNPKGLITAAFGTLVAAVLGWKGKGLLTVAVGACAAVALMQGLLLLF